MATNKCWSSSSSSTSSLLLLKSRNHPRWGWCIVTLLTSLASENQSPSVHEIWHCFREATFSHFMKHILRLVNYYKNILLTITTNIFTFDVSFSIRDLHQKKYDQFFFRFLHLPSLYRDEGSYTLSHTSDRFLATSHHYCGKNRKKNWSYFFW